MVSAGGSASKSCCISGDAPVQLNGLPAASSRFRFPTFSDFILPAPPSRTREHGIKETSLGLRIRSRALNAHESRLSPVLGQPMQVHFLKLRSRARERA